MNKMAQFEKSTKIVNESDGAKIHETLKPLLQQHSEEIQKNYRDHLESMYIYGSAPRGEFNTLFSDLNLVVVLKDDTILAEQKSLKNLRFLNLITITKSEFLSNTHEMRKLRFILHADGVLIHGSDLIGDENFPKAGLELAYLLNFDVMNDINNFEKWLKKNPVPSKKEMDKFAKRYAKRYIDFIFGVAMTNEPYYTSSRLKRLEWIRSVFQDMGHMSDMMLAILRSEAILEYEKLVEIIEIFKDQAQKNITKMKKIVDNLQTQ